MDTDQDAYPGFEIAKFSPVNTDNDNPKDDEILKTPERDSEDRGDSEDEDSADANNDCKEKDDASEEHETNSGEHETIKQLKSCVDDSTLDEKKNEDVNDSKSEEVDDDKEKCDEVDNNNSNDAVVSINSNIESAKAIETNSLSDTDKDNINGSVEDGGEVDDKDSVEMETDKVDDEAKHDEEEGSDNENIGGKDIAMEGEDFTIEINEDSGMNAELGNCSGILQIRTSRLIFFLTDKKMFWVHIRSSLAECFLWVPQQTRRKKNINKKQNVLSGAMTILYNVHIHVLKSCQPYFSHLS